MFDPCFLMQYVLNVRYLAGEERAGCFTLIVSLMSCGCLCSLSLPHGAVGWSAVCACGISWPYSLIFCNVRVC